jgi:hypothetical protein
MRHEGDAGRREEEARQSMMHALAGDPDPPALEVEPHQPITVCPWPSVHRVIAHKPFRKTNAPV